MSEQALLLRAYKREIATTSRVLHAFPQSQSELRPHPRSMTARELAWMFVLEAQLGLAALADDPCPEPAQPIPDRLEEIRMMFLDLSDEFMERLRDAPASSLDEPATIPLGPRLVGEISRSDLLWTMLHDQIHHRGQLSVYLRMAGGKVPSIYGPTADEPWP